MRLFIVSGLNKLLQFDATQAFMAGSGIAMAGLLLVITIALERVAGNMILVAYHDRLAAASLGLFLSPVTVIFIICFHILILQRLGSRPL